MSAQSSNNHIDFVNADAVRECLSMQACVDLMEDTMLAIYRNEVVLPLRTIMQLAGANGLFAVMPGASSRLPVFGVKLISFLPDNPSKGLPAAQGVIMLFDNQSGKPLVMVDAATVTAIRTAAASGMATRLLARSDAKTVALLGLGVQAESHLAAMLAVRPVERVLVWGRSPEKAEQFIEKQRAQFDIPMQAVSTAQLAVEQADIVCTITASHEPILQGSWLTPGTHLNLVGAHSASTREVDTETIRRARLFVEVKEFALQEAGDILIPMNENAIDEDHIIGEIAQVIDKKVEGRLSEDDITLYKSLGNTAQDLAAAYKAYEFAKDKNKSISFYLG